jgi:hypothetical protein
MGSPMKELIPDALVPHLSATLTMDWESPPLSITRLLRNVMTAIGRNHDGPNVEQVAKRCGVDALAGIESFAGNPGQLTFERMCDVQRLVLNTDRVSFRNGIAYTGVRNERYAYFSSIEDMFRTKIAADDQDGCHPLVKAVRLYLDIIFFHPFPDGNARAALLWFMFHCLRNRYPVPDFRRFFAFDFVPGNRACYWRFCLMAIQEVLNHAPHG